MILIPPMILVIDNYDSFTYNLVQIIRQKEPGTLVVKNDDLTLNDIVDLSPVGIVLSPGPGRPEAAGISVDVVRRFSGSIPLLGVCLGHQTIAIAFGGDVVQADEIIHGKASAVYHQGGRLYQHVPSPFQVGRYHSLMVEKITLPSVLQVEAETACGTIMGLRHVEHLTFGVQFHPESILSPKGASVVTNFVELCQTEVCVTEDSIFTVTRSRS